MQVVSEGAFASLAVRSGGGGRLGSLSRRRRVVLTVARAVQRAGAAGAAGPWKVSGEGEVRGESPSRGR